MSTTAAHSVLDEPSSKELLTQFGIAVPRSIQFDARDALDAVDSVFVDRTDTTLISAPFALKAIAHGVSHKSDVGGVALRLSSLDEVRSAITAMGSAFRKHGHLIDAFLLEEMAPAGHEVVVGGTVDPAFGPVIMTGLGGVFVEVFADIAFRVCPITPRDAHSMLDELRSVIVLSGARGGIVADRAAIVDVLLRVGGEGGLLMANTCGVREIDINPLIVSANGAVAVDARVVLA